MELRAAAEARADLADRAVHDGSLLFNHGERTARAVLLLHGYTHAPSQLEPLAREFFARGYNVWVPRAPHHGTSVPDRPKIEDLTAYAERAWTLSEELGEEVGVVGVSAGGVLAAWLATQRPVRRLLLLAPFFAPGRLPSIAIGPLVFLYSRGLLPDRTTSRGYSLRDVAQYLRLAARLRPKARLESGAVVFSERDDVVDPAAAARRLAGISLVSHVLPASLGLGHNIVDAVPPETLRLYADLYEGAVTSVREG
ncbi:alpha/beta fold hydrolase [Actinoplanes solisilvae]|uniref:alpha/beta fold hydrolase n=1 Tax=Actinoplanes solisilvae TaxID=2486853 RepID=UPI000FD8F283|nr:alpha/beta fold hydrolase [Actinoplanes solisilvae]